MATLLMRSPEWSLIMITDPELDSHICDLVSTLINSLATVDQFVSYMAITAVRRHCWD